jgi:hypothetical protein
MSWRVISGGAGIPKPDLSIFDGWWIEGFNGRNGWAYGRTAADGDRDAADAEEIYQMSEDKIIPLYYKISDDCTPPHYWVRVMKESIKSNGPMFSALRRACGMSTEVICLVRRARIFSAVPAGPCSLNAVGWY